MRSSSTAFAAWPSSTARRSSCSRATASRSGATSPSSCCPPGATCSTARSSCATSEGREDFDALGQRIHPAVSRIERLAGETPAVYVAFDLLAHEEESLLERPFSERRAALERAARRRGLRPGAGRADATVETPAEAELWLQDAEGAIAKERSAPYRPGRAQGDGEGQARAHDRRRVVGWRPARKRAPSAR